MYQYQNHTETKKIFENFNDFSFRIGKRDDQNLKLVIFTITRYFKGYPDKNDLIYEGYKGYALAKKRFNPEKGFKFSTYAVNSIKSRLLNYLRCDRRIKEKEIYDDSVESHGCFEDKTDETQGTS